MVFLRLALGVTWTVVITTARRLYRGPRLAGWPFLFELAVALIRRTIRSGVTLPPAMLRRSLPAAPVNRQSRAQILHASTTLGGRPTEISTPVGWSEGAHPTLLYFPGGGYVIGSPATHRDLIARLAIAAGARVVAVDYRKAPEHPFPAAADDADAAYRALLADGLSPGRFFLAGDSAGGALALASAVQARDAGLPLPRALLLFSPWTDLACPGESIEQNAPFDYLTAPALGQSAERYLNGADVAHARASVIHADLRGLPSLFVESGGAELLLSDNQQLAALAAAAGVRVVHHIEGNMVHVFPAFSSVLPQARAAIARAGDFVRSQQ
ncbi:MAG TPA: alpha/beta hydrolase fold domain-containing protein [Polyangia bacterium]|nr:alpha/beta hydrolase fold domain-containing protein [Polyangia bacterium]